MNRTSPSKVWPAISVLLALVTGCSDDSPPTVSDGGPDTDTDADSDTDTDSDSDTDSNSDSDSDVTCESVPETCEDIGATEDEQYYGCCMGDTVFNCFDIGEGWQLYSRDCSLLDMECGYDADKDAMGCIGGSDSDTDADTDTDGFGDCEGEPSTCEDIGDTPEMQEFGCCFEDVLYLCTDVGDGWQLYIRNCPTYGMTCGYDDELGSMGCI